MGRKELERKTKKHLTIVIDERIRSNDGKSGVFVQGRVVQRLWTVMQLVCRLS